ncbi:MAG: DUF1998 domain-containing protein [Firmicutes bacterium]|nr:DUF1998 domain-containing protein [Bacillota bacterium]
MPNWPIRRGQLIAPFGVGAMIIMRDGISLIVCGLDHWFNRSNPDQVPVQTEEFYIKEERLEKQLGVDCFYMPPDYRIPRRGIFTPNADLKIPCLRFPTWHYCRRCGLLQKFPDTARKLPPCPDCEARGRKSYFVQVPFVTICDFGHLHDFPWNEWVHRTPSPDCHGPLRLRSTGGLTLANQRVTCEGCGTPARTLAGITNAAPDGTTTELSSTLDFAGRPFLCTGSKPWLGAEARELCGRPLRGALRNASNVYFAQIRSSIYLPQDISIPEELDSALREERIWQLVEILQGAGQLSGGILRRQHPELLGSFSDDQIMTAIQQRTKVHSQAADDSTPDHDPDTAFLYEEYRVLQEPHNHRELQVRSVEVQQYEPTIKKHFSRIMLIDRMRETRAFAGFTRVYPESNQTLGERLAMLWRNPPPPGKRWLPAYIVHGEGIFLELNFQTLVAWQTSQSAALLDRFEPLNMRYQTSLAMRGLHGKRISPVFVLVHTLSHLLINELTYECGYSTASLRERLYVSDNPKHPMAGLLIYTAAGDAEGTLGGLVQMGLPGRFDSVLGNALAKASWCSADPVCLELGSQGGRAQIR